MEVIDWGLARSTGRRVAASGPSSTPEAARSAVAELRALARYAEGPVRERTGLSAGAAGEAVVVDRTSWIDSNVDGFRVVLAPLLERMATEQPSVVTAVGSRVTALQMGGVLGYLSSKVLGQFEAFTASGDGRLLLVAPNIVAAERQLGVDPRDFRLWVCLHEETHRVQFGAVPWLGPHLVGEIHDYLMLSEVSAGDAARRFAKALTAVLAAVRGEENASIVDAVQSPEQRVVLDRITALMSLLEGHADHVMDDVGPEIVPTVATIRARFERRRSEPGAVDGLARRVLGLDAKLRQYTEGRAFVTGAVGLVGRDGFNRVWERAENLPTRDEVLDPSAWCARVAPDLLA
ncbi:MAG: coenzyme F420 biosynthesis-associated protein [Frankiales bacterium]|nr:coenzyme F420 biosynthesis-associated protein [Frankiales bacterium]